MDLSTLLKFAHVFAAVLWVGGGFTMIIAGVVLAGRSTAETQLAVVRATVLLAPRLFVPLSVFTLASGVTLLFVAGWGWQPFTILGLVGVVFTASFGTFVLGPMCGEVVKLEQAKGAAAAIPMLRRLQRLATFDYAIQFAIVFLMVTKPDWQDFAVLGGLVAVVVLALLASIRPVNHVTV